jgi:hypothetical protein
VFTPISAIFSLLFFASTLPNGIRLVELPAEGDTVEIVAGYTSDGLTGFASTAAARSLLFDAYAVGAGIDLVDEPDRTALRITAPNWALPLLADSLPALFQDIPKGDEGAAPSSPDFRAEVEKEIRSALLPPPVPALRYATDEAFVLISAPAPNSLREALAAIPKRASGTRPEETISRLPAERSLRFKSDLPAGGVIFASPIPGMYYKQWYSVLLLDRLIHRAIALPLKSTLPLTVRSHYYRLELTIPAGQFPEPAEENLLQELQRLQFTPANTRDLTAARQEALAYLESKPVREWFASHDMLDRRKEGIEWIQSMSADDMRVAARDLLIMNRVIASWAPKPRQTSVASEPLTARVGAVGEAQARSQSAPTVVPQTSIAPTLFPTHMHLPISIPLPEHLSNGVWIVSSTANAVFISGGAIARFDRDFTSEDLKSFQPYRADRILVLTPASSMDRARQLWSAFRGSTSAETGVPKGKVSSGDLSALFILKTVLDLKLIEAGWWRDASLRIDAGEGSGLLIQADEARRAQILDWIRTFASAPPSDMYYAWAREVAAHRFDSARTDLQALTWERDPQGTIQDPETVLLKHVQDVARIYF